MKRTTIFLSRGRYTVPFADVTCDAPPGTDRSAFLAEVRALGRLPETVQAVSPWRMR